MIYHNHSHFKYKNRWHSMPTIVPYSSNVTTAKQIYNLPIGLTHQLPDFPVIGTRPTKKYYPSIMRGKTWRKKK